MIGLSETILKKLTKVAAIVNAEKQLYCFGVIRHEAAPDRWDVVVSAKKLRPWSTDAIIYLAELLKKELTIAEMVQIAQVVVLPRDNEWIVALNRTDQHRPGAIRRVLSPQCCDEALVFRPAEDSARGTVAGQAAGVLPKGRFK